LGARPSQDTLTWLARVGGPGKVWLRRRFNADPIVHGGTNALLGA